MMGHTGMQFDVQWRGYLRDLFAPEQSVDLQEAACVMTCGQIMLTTGHLLSNDRVFHFWTAVDVNSPSFIDQNWRRNFFGHFFLSKDNFKWVTGKSKHREIDV